MKNQLLFLFLIAVLLYACADTASQSEAMEETPQRTPNIIYILADDLGYGDLSCYGQQKFQTPNIDKLAAEGMKFTQHYAGSTVCAPSRSVLMSGRHTGHTFIRGNKEVQPEGQYPLADSVVTVAELIQRAGYITGAIGKWGLGAPGSEGAPENQGFDSFFGYNCQREAHHFYPTHLWRNDEKVLLPENENDQRETYTHDLFEQETLDFIRQHQDTSFFLYLPFTIPHADVDVPQEYVERFAGQFEEVPFEGGHYIAQPTPYAAFAGMMTRLDETIGKIEQLITELGLDENTLIIFTSDNGPHKEGGHNPDFFDSNGPLRGYKRDMYEGGIRVPFIAHWDGHIAPGSTSDHISAFWDFLPTACELADIQVPTAIDGISYLPTLLGTGEQPQQDYMFWEFHEQGGKMAVRKGKWKAVRLNVNANPPGDPVELYDLSVDLGEENNIADQHPEIVEELTQLMQEAHRPSEVFAMKIDGGK